MEHLNRDRQLWDYLSGEMDAESRLETERWIAESAVHQKYFNDFRQHYLVLRWSQRRKLIRYDRFDEVYGKIRKRVYMRRLRMAASVVILLGAGWAGWTVLRPVQKDMPVLVQTEYIRPGSPQAMLVLSGGREVPLKDLNTELKEKDGTRIRVDEDGKVCYAMDTRDTLSLKNVYNEMRIPRGGEFRILLADGTKVWLNSATELKYPTSFTGPERVVYLQGEAYFEVMRDSLHPFVVKAGPEVDVRVYGTEFNVNTYSGAKVETVLVKGAVGVKSQEYLVRIQPGEKAEYVEGKPGIAVEKVDVTPYVAWRDGNFVFQDEPLGDIMEKLSLWYNVEVVFSRNDLKTVRLSGDMKRYEEINELLYFFEKSSGIKFKIQNRTIIVDD